MRWKHLSRYLLISQPQIRISQPFHPAVSAICNQTLLPAICNRTAHISIRFMSQQDHEDELMKSIAAWQIPNPYTSFHNWIFGLMVRGYYKQEFVLQDFLYACPHALIAVIDHLKNEQFEKLWELMSQSCANKAIDNWNKLTPAQKRIISNMTAKEYFFKHPKIRMRMPDKKSSDVEVPSFLNIRMMLMHRVDYRVWEEYFPKDIDLGVSDKVLGEYKNPVKHALLAISAQSVEFEREVTKGVEGFWEIKDIGSFPIPSPLFQHSTPN